MSDNTQQILAIIEGMRDSIAAYDTGAKQIWDLLSPDEQQCLTWVLSRTPVWKGEVEDNHPIYRLLSCKLLTWSTYRENEGYIVGTFIGYATMKSQKA